MKIFKSLENSNLLTKGVTKTIKNEAKEQRVGFFDMFVGTLNVNFLQTCDGATIPKGRETVRAIEVATTTSRQQRQDFQCRLIFE